jgi:CheY-like chemotaxis protein
MDQRARILIIDDEPMLRRALVRALSRHFDVTGVASCEEALDAIGKRARFDAILCDLHLDGMSGRELCAELERMQVGQAERVIVHSGSPRDLFDDIFIDAVKGRYLQKPASMEDVREIVDVMIQIHGRAA